MDSTIRRYEGVRKLDIIIGLAYGTNRTTSNKENQILVKLLKKGFIEEDRATKPGILIDEATRTIRVYRRIGREFWAMIGNPALPNTTPFVFLEILLSLSLALTTVLAQADLETRINSRILALIGALKRLMFPRKSLPDWMRHEFTDSQLFWFASALTAFYDEGM